MPVSFLRFPNLSHRRWVIPAVAFVPAILTGGLIFKLGVDVPRVDHWNIAEAFGSLAAGENFFSVLWREQNEHRVVVPKLVMLLLGYGSGWNVKLEMFVSLLFASAGLLAILGIAWRSAGGVHRIPGDAAAGRAGPLVSVLITLACAMVYFSWMQYENWLWGFQIAFFITQAAFLFALFVLHRSEWCPWWRLGAAVLFASVASFSMLHGLAAWIALVPSVLAIRGTRRLRRAALVVWIIAACSATAVFLSSPVKAHSPTSLENAGLKIWQTLEFTMGMLGGQFGRSFVGDPSGISVAAGAVIVLMIGSGLLVALASRVPWEEISPWVSLALFAGAFCFAIACGRSEWGPFVMTVSRYMTGPPLAVIAGLQLWRLAVESRQSRWLSHALSIVCVLVCVGVLKNSLWALGEVRTQHAQWRLGQVVLPMADRFSPLASSVTGGAFAVLTPPGGLKRVVDGMRVMTRLNIRKLAEWSDARIDALVVGEFDMIRSVEARGFPVIGLSVAALPTRVRPDEMIRLRGRLEVQSGSEIPDAILFAKSGDPAFRTAAMLSEDPENRGWYAWDHLVEAAAFGEGISEVEAFAYDADTHAVQLLAKCPKPLEVRLEDSMPLER